MRILLTVMLSSWVFVSCSEDQQENAPQDDPTVSSSAEKSALGEAVSWSSTEEETSKQAPAEEQDLARPSEIRAQHEAKGHSPDSVHETYNTEAWEGKSIEDLNKTLTELEGWIAGIEEADEPHPNYKQFKQMRKELIAYLNEEAP